LIYGKWNVTQYSESQNGTYNDMAILGWYAQFNSDVVVINRILAVIIQERMLLTVMLSKQSWF
jgi:hypothetical protein